MICKKCGTIFSEGIFCPECGAKIEMRDSDEILGSEEANQEKIEQEGVDSALEESDHIKQTKIGTVEGKIEKSQMEDESVKQVVDEERKFPWYLSIWFIVIVCILTLGWFCIPGIILGIIRGHKKRTAKNNSSSEVQRGITSKVKTNEITGTDEEKIPWYLSIWFILVISILTFWIFWIPGIVLGIMRFVLCKEKRISAIVIVTLLISPYAMVIFLVISSVKTEKQFNTYIENEQYESAREYIEQKYTAGSSSYVEKYAQLYMAQEMYDEAVDMLADYCSNEYEPVNIPDYRIKELNEYIVKYENSLQPETIENVQNLIRNKDMALAEEQARKEAEEQDVKEVEKRVLDETKKVNEEVVSEAGNDEKQEDKIDKSPNEIVEQIDEEDFSEDMYDEWYIYEQDQVEYDERGFYTIDNFPYQNSKQADKLKKIFESAAEADNSEFVNVERGRKGVFDSSVEYKQTTGSSDYKYYGEMKNGLPNGQGIVLEYISRYGAYLPEVLGNFKNGQLDGYAIKFSSSIVFEVSVEGNYKKGIENGDFVLYSNKLLNYEAGTDNDVNVIDQFERFVRRRKEELYDPNGTNVVIIIDIPITTVYASGIGKYKDGKMINEWIAYYANGTIASEIKIKKDGESGEGSKYYIDGTIMYKGELKNGKYHGKGTLYREDGSIEYEGKFKDGKIDN